MKPQDLINVAQTLDQDKEILCQVVGSESGCWNVGFTLTKPKDCSFNVLSVSHPQLLHLPDSMDEKVVIDICEFGHRFARLSNHPMSGSKPSCPHCMTAYINIYKA